MRPSLEELKTIWTYAYSKAALSEAVGYVEEMETTAPDSTPMHALVSASIIAYSRPFTASQLTKTERRIPLKDVEVPQSLKNTHDHILRARHRIVGHKDAELNKNYLPSNVLTMKRTKCGATFMPMGVHEMKPWARQEMRELCAHFVDHCNQQLSPLMERYKPEFLKRDLGTYRVVLCEPPDEWLEPFDDFWVMPFEGNRDSR